MINVVIPMAGAGSRFAKAGYAKPKPFIDVAGKSMIERVMENLAYPDANYILLARKEHMEQETNMVRSLCARGNVEFISIDKLTEGTACTVLFAKSKIDGDNPLLIANSDQIVDINMAEFIDDCFQRKLDGSILTFQDELKNPKWSFVKVDEDNIALEVKEKMPISDIATVGIYLFRQGRDFVDSAVQMIIENDRVNGEFYTCPAYNYAIRDCKRIGIYNIRASQMHGLGTPEDLAAYLTLIE